MVKKPKKKPKAKISAEERKRRKIKNDHVRTVRSVLRNVGFERADEIAGVEVSVAGQKGEFDDAFVYENLIVFVEYTTTQSSDVTHHLKNKHLFFSRVMADTKAFVAQMRSLVPAFDARLGTLYHPDRMIFKIVYCSRFEFDVAIKSIVKEPEYLDFDLLKYFEKLASVVKMSAMPELLDFLKVDPLTVARAGKFPSKAPSDSYDGIILPEASSGFPANFKVVSFYADADALLRRAYVLRRSGWRATAQAYQRMVSPPKIEEIRKKLRNDGKVFVNNLIVTLPSDVHPEGADGKTIDISTLTETEPVKIRLPGRPNCLGVIDGQHRLYSYYESKVDDPEIAKLRHQQNLLTTGIIYPVKLDDEARERFEAELFLGINSKQTNASTRLLQEIEVLLHPYSTTAIGRRIVDRLAKTGPLAGHIETYFFDKGKLKTSSVVSYGLAPLIKFQGPDSLFQIFQHQDKSLLEQGESAEALSEYIDFCVTRINVFLGAVKANIDDHRWTPEGKIKDRLLAVTYVNAFLIVLRFLVEAKGDLVFHKLKDALSGLNKFPFKDYHSSQYARMATKIFQQHFPDLAKAPSEPV